MEDGPRMEKPTVNGAVAINEALLSKNSPVAPDIDTPACLGILHQKQTISGAIMNEASSIVDAPPLTAAAPVTQGQAPADISTKSRAAHKKKVQGNKSKHTNYDTNKKVNGRVIDPPVASTATNLNPKIATKKSFIDNQSSRNKTPESVNSKWRKDHHQIWQSGEATKPPAAIDPRQRRVVRFSDDDSFSSNSVPMSRDESLTRPLPKPALVSPKSARLDVKPMETMETMEKPAMAGAFIYQGGQAQDPTIIYAKSDPGSLETSQRFELSSQSSSGSRASAESQPNSKSANQSTKARIAALRGTAQAVRRAQTEAPSTRTNVENEKSRATAATAWDQAMGNFNGMNILFSKTPELNAASRPGTTERRGAKAKSLSSYTLPPSNLAAFQFKRKDKTQETNLQSSLQKQPITNKRPRASSQILEDERPAKRLAMQAPSQRSFVIEVPKVIPIDTDTEEWALTSPGTFVLRRKTPVTASAVEPVVTIKQEFSDSSSSVGSTSDDSPGDSSSQESSFQENGSKEEDSVVAEILPEAQIVSHPSGPSTTLLETDNQALNFSGNDPSHSRLSTQAEFARAQRSLQMDLKSQARRASSTSAPRRSISSSHSVKIKLETPPATAMHTVYKAATPTTPPAEAPPSTQALVDAMSPFLLSTTKKPKGLLGALRRPAAALMGYIRGNQLEQTTPTVTATTRKAASGGTRADRLVSSAEDLEDEDVDRYQLSQRQDRVAARHPSYNSTSSGSEFEIPRTSMPASQVSRRKRRRGSNRNVSGGEGSKDGDEGVVVDSESDFETSVLQGRVPETSRNEMGQWIGRRRLLDAHSTPLNVTLRSVSSSQALGSLLQDGQVVGRGGAASAGTAVDLETEPS
jgi:hypothetical protein